MTSTNIIEILRGCELFSTVAPEDLKHIAELCSIETMPAGEAVTTQGEFSRRLFLIAEGQVALLRTVNLGGRQATTRAASPPRQSVRSPRP